MVDKKWLLSPGPLEPMPLGMNCKPWYKDRLPSKCFAKHKNKLLKFPTTLDSRRWIFVKEGLDDFRRGCPPCEDLITRSPKEGFLPMIAHRVPKPALTKNQKKLTHEADLFSTLSPAQLARKAFVEDIEDHLTEHPLALYPSLEKDLPPDLLLKVLEVLDPDKKLKDTWTYCQNTEKRTKPPTKLSEKRPAKVNPELPKKTPGSHPDKLPHEERRSSTKDLLKNPALHRKVPRGVRKFCKWIATFGDLGIDEEFIMKQFDIGFECKPTYDRSHTKKVNHVPLDLKYRMGLDKMDDIKFSIHWENWERKLKTPQNPYKPNWVKMRYGAWYLKPKLWKNLINDEPLIDPKVLHEAQGGRYGKNFPEQDILEDLYGTIAFKDFILNKGYRMPGFLEKLFTRKGWKYDSVRTPIHKVKINSSVENAHEGV
ncbi:protein FAM47E-like [Phoca vitulina]|uniref:protein FAM47E-like n=1 Tax=Phoca vitulina TaxID=9720 RepID=UPI00139626D2|nr:protein FAM47E-like [Phoca vitulina]XP_035929005.1 protein FAM47E-like [Halichoerus grypus]